MYNHSPPNYDCPFCRRGFDSEQEGWLFEEGSVYAKVPPHYWGSNKGNCLVIPKAHFENIFDLDPEIGRDIIRATKILSFAMKNAFRCDGISTRQHNEPAGNQDVWHYHQHVFPRYRGDGLYSGSKMRYSPEERLYFARELRAAIAEKGSNRPWERDKSRPRT